MMHFIINLCLTLKYGQLIGYERVICNARFYLKSEQAASPASKLDMKLLNERKQA